MWNIKKILIAVLSFSLLFAVSCDNEGKTGGGGTGGGGSSGGSQSKSELVGTYRNLASVAGSIPIKFTVDTEGNITFARNLTPGMLSPIWYTNTGKIADTFDYPYTVEISTTTDLGGKINETTKKGTIRFDSLSSGNITWFMAGPNISKYYDDWTEISQDFERRD